MLRKDTPASREAAGPEPRAIGHGDCIGEKGPSKLSLITGISLKAK